MILLMIATAGVVLVAAAKFPRVSSLSPDTKAKAAITPAVTVEEQPQSAWSLGDKLQLKDAKDRGLLSEDEYADAKCKAIEHLVVREAVC